MGENSANHQKIKLLKIMELLNRETDEDHPLRTGEICARLLDMEITCDTRTLGKDMRFLQSQGYEIMCVMAGHEKAYYVEDRSFSIPELKILTDAVEAASFITEKKSGELKEKIAALGGEHRAEILRQSGIRFNTNKHTNESILYVVSTLEEALVNGKKVSFRYFHLDENGERIYRSRRDRYTAEPLSLVFHEDNYYLLCYSTYFDRVYPYRVDRMSDAEIVEEEISAKTKDVLRNLDAAAFTEQAFRMYGGTPKSVTIEFSEDLIGAVYDRFGEDTKMKRLDNGHITANIRVLLSPMFFGWFCQFGGQMKITWPDTVIKELKEYLLTVNTIN